MLEPLKHLLSAQRIVLASGSPRRREVLQNIGLKFKVIPSDFDENLDPKSFPSPEIFVEALSLGKAQEVAARYADDRPDLVIGADTMVVFDSKVLGKPTSKEHAREMLSSFSGHSHFVYTGMALVTATNVVQFHEKTEVQMAVLSPEVIDAYIETGEPMDKAGGYGIQGLGGTLVKSVHGDYFNVVGFPLHKFCDSVTQLFEKNILLPH